MKKEKIIFKLLVMEVMGDFLFGTNLLELYISIRNGLDYSQVIVSNVCWEAIEGVI